MPVATRLVFAVAVAVAGVGLMERHFEQSAQIDRSLPECLSSLVRLVLVVVVRVSRAGLGSRLVELPSLLTQELPQSWRRLRQLGPMFQLSLTH